MKSRSISLGLPTAMLLFLLLPLIALRASEHDTSHYANAAYRVEAGTLTEPIVAIQGAGAESLGLIVTATVGIDPGVCASTVSARVAPNTQVYYCYRATNTGDEILTTHTVTDTRAGVIWDRHSFQLGPGETLSTVEEGLTLNERVERNSRTQTIWTATAVSPTLTTTATAETSVVVVEVGVAITKTAGIVGAGCTDLTESVVPDGGDSTFCVIVENTGSLPLVQHSLTDPILTLDTSFAYTLPPSELLTITNSALPNLGIDGGMVRRELTRSFVNTVYYTATSADDAADTGMASASDTASVTVSLAAARVRLTATVALDPAQCSDDTSLTVSRPDTDLYFCAILGNEGNVPITHHALEQPGQTAVTHFEHMLAPGTRLSVTNVLLDQWELPRTLGPLTIFDGFNQTLSNALIYTGTTSLPLGREGQTRAYTATASSLAYAGLASTPSPTPTASFTPRSATARPTNTSLPATPTWTPLPALDLGVQQVPVGTATATRSYAISLLSTPTPSSQAVSPLSLSGAQSLEAAAVAATATQEAAATLAALYATATAAAVSPVATPSPTLVTPPTPVPTPSLTETPTVMPAEEALAVVATSTPLAPTQRPVQLPPPAPTPDYLLVAARTVDTIVMTATWIWFLVGTLIFFVVAGVLTGLSFRQNERQRFDLVDSGFPDEFEFLLPPPAPQRDDPDAWLE